MPLHWHDLPATSPSASWRGLGLAVTGVPRPSLGARWAAHGCSAFGTSDLPFLWLRPRPDWFALGVVRAPRLSSPAVVPPIAFADARQVCSHADRTRHASWARWFAHALSQSDNSPLWDGTWQVTPFRQPGSTRPGYLPVAASHECLQSSRFTCVDWNVGAQVLPLLLRAPCSPESARVNAYRKLVQDDTLPPVLVGWYSGAAAPVVLDGHDRLVACAFDGVDAPVLELTSVRHVPADADAADALAEALARQLERGRLARERAPQVPADRYLSTERMNDELMAAYAPTEAIVPSRALPAAGGWRAWHDGACAAAGPDVALPGWFTEPPIHAAGQTS